MIATRRAAFGAAVFFVAVCTSAKADVQMVPLKDMLSAEASLANGATMLVRCSSLFTIIGQWLQDQSDSSNKKLGKNYEQQAADTFNFWKITQSALLDRSAEELDILFVNKMKIIVPEYDRMMARAKALTGDVFSNPVVLSDLKTCSQYKEILNDIIQRIGK